MSRRFRPRRLDPLPEGLLPVTCEECSHRGLFDWRRGLVIHPLTPTCHVQVPAVVDEQAEEAAA